VFVVEAETLYILNRLADVIETCTEGLEQYPDNGTLYYFRGVARHQLGRQNFLALQDLTKAADHFADEKGDDPTLGDIYFARGLILKAMGRVNEAQADFRQALRLNPEISQRLT
jgi:tetratricopeptide (TPR) repeat protein